MIKTKKTWKLLEDNYLGEAIEELFNSIKKARNYEWYQLIIQIKNDYDNYQKNEIANITEKGERNKLVDRMVKLLREIETTKYYKRQKFQQSIIILGSPILGVLFHQWLVIPVQIFVIVMAIGLAVILLLIILRIFIKFTILEKLAIYSFILASGTSFSYGITQIVSEYWFKNKTQEEVSKHTKYDEDIEAKNQWQGIWEQKQSGSHGEITGTVHIIFNEKFTEASFVDKMPDGRIEEGELKHLIFTNNNRELSGTWKNFHSGLKGHFNLKLNSDKNRFEGYYTMGNNSTKYYWKGIKIE